MKHGKPETNWWQLLSVAAIAGVMLILSVRATVPGLRRGLEWPVVQLMRISDRMGRWVHRPFDRIMFMANGPERIADLESRLAEMAVDRARVVELERDIQALTRLEDAGRQPGLEYRPIRLLQVRGNDFLVEAGKAEELEVGAPLVVGEVVVGLVREVGVSLSKASRLGEMPINGRIAGSEVTGLVERDKSDGKLIMTGVLQSEAVAEGEVVVSEGSEGMPKGLILGVVEAVRMADSDTERSIRLRELIDISKYPWVSIVGRN